MGTLPPPRSKNILLGLTSDGLLCPPIKPHTRDKLYTLAYYLEEFTTAMTGKYPNLVYIDLFAGAGRNQFPSGAIIEGSPLIAARTMPQFTKMIFVEEDGDCRSALIERLDQDFSARDFKVIPGDCNVVIDDVIAEIPPPPPRGSGVLTVCFADPFDLSIKFATLAKFMPLWVDFIILIADRMAGARDTTLIDPSSQIVADFLADPDWRTRWELAQQGGASIQDFLTERFTAAMERLGLRAGKPLRINVEGKEVPLYWLSFFSRNDVALKLWNSARINAPLQKGLY